MKKLIFFTLAAMSLLFFLCGCDQNKPLQDGTYVARWGSFDAHGWREYVIITVAGSKVRDITFWTLGSLQNSSYENAFILAAVFAVCGARDPGLAPFARRLASLKVEKLKG